MSLPKDAKTQRVRSVQPLIQRLQQKSLKVRQLEAKASQSYSLLTKWEDEQRLLLGLSSGKGRWTTGTLCYGVTDDECTDGPG